MNEVTKRLNKKQSAKGWTNYQLSEESGVSQNTIKYWYNSEAHPEIPQLRKACAAIGFPISDLFTEGNMVELTPERKAWLEDLESLDHEQKELARSLIRGLRSKK